MLPVTKEALQKPGEGASLGKILGQVVRSRKRMLSLRQKAFYGCKDHYVHMFYVSFDVKISSIEDAMRAHGTMDLSERYWGRLGWSRQRILSPQQYAFYGCKDH
jgi:hypothetical protein